MQLDVMSPRRLIFTGEVDLVQLPGRMGSFEILHNHAPLVAILDAGRIKVIDVERNQFYIPIEGGSVEVLDNRIVVLVD